MKRGSLLVILILLFNFTYAEDKPKFDAFDRVQKSDRSVTDSLLNLDDLESHQKIDDFVKELELLQKQTALYSETRKNLCLRAFGDAEFCKCVFDNIPVIWTFYDYIAITTTSRNEAGYDKFSEKRKASYDRTRKIRDECVAKLKSSNRNDDMNFLQQR